MENEFRVSRDVGMEREKKKMIPVFWVLVLVLVGLGAQAGGECSPCVVARQEISATSICTRWAQQSIFFPHLGVN